MKRLRQATVEPVIGTLINFLGMRRVNTRGIELANKCLLMAAVCYNLKRMLKWVAEGSKKTEKTPAKLLFVLWCLLVKDGRTKQFAAIKVMYCLCCSLPT
jgi:hypothetical protein